MFPEYFHLFPLRQLFHFWLDDYEFNIDIEYCIFFLSELIISLDYVGQTD